MVQSIVNSKLFILAFFLPLSWLLGCQQLDNSFDPIEERCSYETSSQEKLFLLPKQFIEDTDVVFVADNASSPEEVRIVGRGCVLLPSGLKGQLLVRSSTEGRAYEIAGEDTNLANVESNVLRSEIEVPVCEGELYLSEGK